MNLERRTFSPTQRYEDHRRRYSRAVHDGARRPKLQLDATYSYNKTTITHIRSQSSVIPIDVLFDQTQRTLLEEGLPHHRGSLGGIYSVGNWRFGLSNTYYGEVSGQGFTGVKQTWGAKWLTDVTVNYRINKNLDVTIGATTCSTSIRTSGAMPRCSR